MDKSCYPQGYSERFVQETVGKAPTDKWMDAYRDMWRMVKLMDIQLSDARRIVIGNWPAAERERFNMWVSFYENQDDVKYKNVLKQSNIDCDIDVVKTAALKYSKNLSGALQQRFVSRINAAKNARTVADIIFAMRECNSPIHKNASESDKDRTLRLFKVVRDIHSDLSRRRLVRNLAALLAQDKEGAWPEVSQSLSKLIDAYGYSLTRIQDVMSRLGLQLSSMNQNSADEESKLSEEMDRVVEHESKKTQLPAPSVPATKVTPNPMMSDKPKAPAPSVPRKEFRGV